MSIFNNLLGFGWHAGPDPSYGTGKGDVASLQDGDSPADADQSNMPDREERYVSEKMTPESDVVEFPLQPEPPENPLAVDDLNDRNITTHGESKDSTMPPSDERMNNQEQVTAKLGNEVRELQKVSHSLNDQVNFNFELTKDLKQENGERFGMLEQINKNLWSNVLDLSRSLREQILKLITLQGDHSDFKEEAMTRIQAVEKRSEESKRIATRIASRQRKVVVPKSIVKAARGFYEGMDSRCENLNTRIDDQEAAVERLKRVLEETRIELEASLEESFEMQQQWKETNMKELKKYRRFCESLQARLKGFECMHEEHHKENAEPMGYDPFQADFEPLQHMSMEQVTMQPCISQSFANGQWSSPT